MQAFTPDFAAAKGGFGGRGFNPGGGSQMSSNVAIETESCSHESIDC